MAACARCGGPVGSRRRYCSNACRQAAWRERVDQLDEVEDAQQAEAAETMRRVEQAESRPPSTDAPLDQAAVLRRSLLGAMAALPPGRARAVYWPRLASAWAQVSAEERRLQGQGTQRTASWLDAMRESHNQVG